MTDGTTAVVDGHEILFRGGPVLTMGPVGRPEAILVRGDRIAATGSEAECRLLAREEPEIIELEGAALLPGFVDAHCHPLMYGQFQTWEDCSWEAAPDIDAVVQRMRAAAVSLPPGTPVRGHGFHHGNVADRRFLRRHDLDRVAEDREVLVFHSSGHGAFVNSWSLNEFGVDHDTVDPAGGHFDREEDGTPAGGVWNAAADVLTGQGGVKLGNHGPNFHLPDQAERLDFALRVAQSDFIAAGVTSVVDAQVTSRELSTYMRLRRRGGLHMRVEMLIISSLLEQLEQLGMGGRLGDEQLALSGVKLYVDGALTGGSAHFSKPYCCDPLDHGYEYHDPSEYIDLVTRAHVLGLQTGTHAQGDAAIAVAIAGLENALRKQPRTDHRHRIEHCGLPAVEDVQKIADLDLYPVTQPQYIYRYGDELRRVLGDDRADRLIPYGEFTASGIPIVLSSDAPVTPPNPLEAIYSAAARRTLSDTVLGEPHALDVMVALRAHTIGAAASIHREHRVGSLEPGKLADLVILSADPTQVGLGDIRQLEVQQTWIDGRRVEPEKFDTDT